MLITLKRKVLLIFRLLPTAMLAHCKYVINFYLHNPKENGQIKCGMWYSMVCYLAIERYKVLVHAITCMNLKTCSMKETATNDHVMYYIIYMECPDLANL